MTNRSRIHLHFAFGEKDGHCCVACGEKTMLIVAPLVWSVDQEAFKAGEFAEAPELVEVHDEVTAHFCEKCEKITALSFNGK